MRPPLPLAAYDRILVALSGGKDSVCSDFVYVHFAATGREITARVRMLPLEILLPTE